MPNLQNILDDLALLPDWEGRYEYIIELGKTLPPMALELKTDARLVRGCTSRVWLDIGTNSNQQITLSLDSDALIVKGLLALIYAAYEGKTAAEVRAFNLPEVLHQSGLIAHLSPNRRNGFASVVARIQAYGAASSAT